MLLGIPGDNTYSNYSEAQRAFWRGTVLPLVNRMAKGFSAWLSPAYGGGVELRPDLDQVEGLSAEREALWARIERASFLTQDEKRAAVGYGVLDGAGDTSLLAARDSAFAGARRLPCGEPAAGHGSARSRPPAHLVKYNPDQPRVPAGNSDGGQWTDGGNGIGLGAGGSSGDSSGSSSGRVRLAQADNGTRNDAGGPLPRASVSQQDTAFGYSPSKSGWHDYAVTNTICPSELRCSKEEIADQMARYGVPGRDPANPVVNGETSLVRDPFVGIPAGFVDTYVSRDGLTIRNRTQPLHIFHDGIIERTATLHSDGSWSVTTHGVGNNRPLFSLLNQEFGPIIFDKLDSMLRDNIRRHHGVDR